MRFKVITAKLRRAVGRDAYEPIAEEVMLRDTALYTGQEVVLTGFRQDIPRGFFDKKPNSFLIVFESEVATENGTLRADHAGLRFGL